MHITKIELENIKSHAHFQQEFQRGTTAIMGENGAGKTTLIEAVAWTLFDLLDYKKDVFLRRGAKKGVARVTFESSKDEREYLVYRDTATTSTIRSSKFARTKKKKKSRDFFGNISASKPERIWKRFSGARSAFRREHSRRSFSKPRRSARRLSTSS